MGGGLRLKEEGHVPLSRGFYTGRRLADESRNSVMRVKGSRREDPQGSGDGYTLLPSG